MKREVARPLPNMNLRKSAFVYGHRDVFSKAVHQEGKGSMSLPRSLALLCLVSIWIPPPAPSLAEQRPAGKLEIPLQGFVEEDHKRFPPGLIEKIQASERDWGDYLWEHRQQYAEAYEDLLGPGIHCTHDVYRNEVERMGGPGYRAHTPYPVIVKKSLRRFPDIAWVSAGQIPLLVDKDIGHLRLLSFRFGRLDVIPFDVVEGTAEGVRVLTHGPENNAAEGDGLLNNTDHLAFKVHDCGHKIAPAYVQAQYGNRALPVEIGITDPQTSEQGWVYLVHFHDAPPPRSPFDYITVRNDVVNQQFSDYIFHQGTFRFEKDRVYRKVFSRAWKYAPYFGHTGEDYLDRMKIRITARMMFGMIKVRFDEDDATGNWTAWKDGQVVAICRAWLGMDLPLGLQSPHLIFDIIASGTVMNVIIDTRVPVNPGRLLTDYTMMIGNDWTLNEHSPGEDMQVRFFSSNNRDGVSVDGVMSEAEKRWEASKDNWRLLTGPPGTICFRSYWDPVYAKQADISVLYVDDWIRPDPPEFDPGQIATLYSRSRVKSLKPGTYHLLIDYYGPPHFKKADGQGYRWDFFNQYLNILDHPVTLTVGDVHRSNWKPALTFAR